jgi:hypothetical protein
MEESMRTVVRFIPLGGLVVLAALACVSSFFIDRHAEPAHAMYEWVAASVSVLWMLGLLSSPDKS